MRCPRAVVPSWCRKVIQAYMHYQNGHLPNKGTWLDQPADLMEAFEVVATAIEHFQNKKAPAPKTTTTGKGEGAKRGFSAGNPVTFSGRKPRG